MGDFRVTILLFGSLREEYGVRELEVNCDGTARNLIENAARALNKDFLERIYSLQRNRLSEDLIFIVNGRSIRDLKGKIEIKEGDRVEVAIVALEAGG